MPIPPKPEYVHTVSVDEWANLPFPERCLHVARSQVGVKETSENWGPMVRIYLKVAGWFTPAAWCLAFAFWCALEAGAVRSKLPKNMASSYFVFLWAKKTGRDRYLPKRGMIAVVNGKKGGHGCWVRLSTLGNNLYESIDGNSNDEGSTEGYEVCDRKRTVAWMRTYPRWCFIDMEGLDQP
jgi:hypothetical protein